ncbi:iron ABC transporter permease [Halobacillus litoralis]|uniref:FecCD family ABC transporter permease n=1 Tax=Halobacillus litoralis TaxID=45668 RepID=UPI001CD4BE09|nr:iron ABC transporter permease [Halobacillus litoralis]MCA0972082.1 iron ABC transporter permease [Halobacillus litoralis]
MTNERKNWLIAIGLVIGIFATLLISLNLGVINISPLEVLQTFLGNGEDQNEMVLFHFRLPRMVIAILIGAAMAVSGAILQSVTQNDLADPGIIGINAGAGFSVILYLFFFQGNAFEGTQLSVFLMPIASLVGSTIAAVLIYAISWKNGISPMRLVLVGIGINSAFSALIIIFQLKMDPKDFTRATVWLSGNISGTDWVYVLTLLPWVLLLIPLAMSKASTLNALHFGDDVAAGLGAAVERERRILLLVAVALAGASVSVGGGIAFVGLVVPHLARKLVGVMHGAVIPISALMGALLLLVADTVGRNILSPSEIPVGLVVSAVGGVYFVYLLMKS